MIGEVLRAAWAQSRATVLVAIVATPAVLVGLWALLVVAIVAGQP